MTIKERILNKERSWTDILPLVYIQAYLWMQLGGLFSTVAKVDKWAFLFTSDAAVAEFIGGYLFSLGFCLSFILAVIIFKKNRPMLNSFKKNILAGAGLGLAAGFVLNASVIACAVATGSLAFSSDGIKLLPLVGSFIVILLQSGGEELICRMYIMGKLRRRYRSPWVAVIGNSLFFTIFHLGNPGITAASVLNILLAGILFSLVVLRFENMWAAIAMHTAWNFTQTIIFGLPNSGLPSVFSILSPARSVDSFFYDTGFGIEGSWAAVIVLCLAIAAVVLSMSITNTPERYEQNTFAKRPPQGQSPEDPS
ncbi:MAG: CPBP family intramembrane metalloprotease [Clostridiales bacterium]|nr:CPBP family intramembrane metalloprotease [Clostridiales bacterium]